MTPDSDDDRMPRLLTAEQHEGEYPDLFVMRAFAQAVPLLQRHEAIAMVQWMWSVVMDAQTWNRRSPHKRIQLPEQQP